MGIRAKTHLALAEFGDVAVAEVWVQLNLVGSRLVLGVGQKLLGLLHAEVANANGLDLALLKQLLHLLPRLLWCKDRTNQIAAGPC